MAQKNLPEAAKRWWAELDYAWRRLPKLAVQELKKVLHHRGFGNEQDAILDEAGPPHPDRLELLAEPARAAMARKAWSSAAQHWQRLFQMEASKANAEMFAAMVRVYRNLGKVNEADTFLEQGLEKFPHDVRLMTERALLDNLRPKTISTSAQCIPYPLVEIVVCIHNALEEVKICLDAVRTKTHKNYLLTVVDDASTPNVGLYLSSITRANPGWRLLRNDTNIGYTRSANRGLRQARTDWVVLLNSDTVVTTGWMDGLLDCVMSDPNLKAAGPLSNAASIQSVPETRDARGKFIINALPAGVSPDDLGDLVRRLSKRAFPRTPMLNGFCILLHKPTVERLGFLDESKFPFGYGEETDLCLRLINAGYKLAIADNVYVYHSRSASFGLTHRQKLINQANKNLKCMWPGYSYRYIADSMEEVVALQELRKALKEDDLNNEI
jgi:GT2 family glycosyltransferase